MGTVEDWKLHMMVTSPALSALILLSLLCVSSSLFFNSSPASTCSSDRQCSGFTRRECVGKQFILCFGQTRTYRVGGKCVTRGNTLCGIGNVFLGGGILVTTESVLAVYQIRTVVEDEYVLATHVKNQQMTILTTHEDDCSCHVK